MLIILANIVWISVASVVILKAWRYRAEAEVTPYLWFMLGQILWSVGYLFEIVSPEFETKVFWDNFQYIGGALLMISLLVFAFTYSGIRFRGIRLFYWATSVPIIIFLIVVFLHPLGPVARPNARLIEGDLNGALIYDISPQVYALMLYAVLLYAVSVRVAARIVLPLALVVSAYIFWRGHNLPGGGFIAGLVTAVALVLQFMALGQARAESVLHGAAGQRFSRWIGSGLAIAGLTGVAAFVFGKPFLTSAHGHPTVAILGELPLASAAVFDLGVYITVVGATLLMLSVLGATSKENHG